MAQLKYASGHVYWSVRKEREREPAVRNRRGGVEGYGLMCASRLRQCEDYLLRLADYLAAFHYEFYLF